MHLQIAISGFGGTFVANRKAMVDVTFTPDSNLVMGRVKVVLHDGWRLWVGVYSDIAIWNGLISAIWLAKGVNTGRLLTWLPKIWTEASIIVSRQIYRLCA